MSSAVASASPRPAVWFRPGVESLEGRLLLNGGPPTAAELAAPVPESATLAMHIHPHLTIILDGVQQVIPAGIGILPGDQAAFSIHTHDTTGTLHVESTVIRDFTLQDFFTVWGQPFSSQQILDFHADAAHPITMTVNGQASDAFGALVLHDGDNIVIRAGSAGDGPAPSGPTSLDFVMQVYRDLLHRDADYGGQRYYANLIDAGTDSRTQVVRMIEDTAEYRMVVVTDLYAKLLGRDPDAAGLAFWAGFLASGGTAEQVEIDITGSAEYFQAGGGTAAGFVADLYHDALGRDADGAGAALFTQELAAGMAPAQVAAQVWGSAERAETAVRAFYRRFLGRDADAAGRQAFARSLEGGTRDEDLIAAVVGSDEYFARLRG